MEEKKELSIVQRFAMQAAKKKADEMNIFFAEIMREVCCELLIPERDIPNWQFTQNFRFAERIKKKENQNGQPGAN